MNLMMVHRCRRVYERMTQGSNLENNRSESLFDFRFVFSVFQNLRQRFIYFPRQFHKATFVWQWMLQSDWSEWKTLNFLGKEYNFSEKKLDVDLPLDERSIPRKFHIIWMHGVEMHSEQTNKHTDKLSSLHMSRYRSMDRCPSLFLFRWKKNISGLLSNSDSNIN